VLRSGSELYPETIDAQCMHDAMVVEGVARGLQVPGSRPWPWVVGPYCMKEAL
jgi:hypothetical protein